MNIVQVPAHAHNFSSRRGLSPDMLVFHVMEGHMAGTAQRFQDPGSHVSAHYGISATGEVVQYADDSYDTWHSGNGEVNRRSIGIECEGFCCDKEGAYLPNPTWLTEAMYQSILALTRALVAKHKITVNRGNLIGHSEVPDPANPNLHGGLGQHKDPGPLFPWDRLMNDLASDMDPEPLV